MSATRRRFLQRIGWSGAGLCFPTPPQIGFRAQTDGETTLTCRVQDSASGATVPARIRLLDQAGQEVVPLGHPAQLAPDGQEGDVRFQSRRFCYVNGSFELPRARLPLRYQVLKGYEFQIEEGDIPADATRQGPLVISLKRWSSLSKSGWYSGDIHIHHIAPQTCRLEMEAEDLNVANILTSDFTTDQDRFEGRVHAQSAGNHLIYVNQEFRNHELGHLCLLNLKQLIQPVREVQPHHHPLHLSIYDRVHDQGGYASWAHFPSWPAVECPLDVAMEKLDGLEILCQMEPREFPIFMKQVVPELESSDGLHLWYRFLNCGFRLTATAGTDKMTNFVTVGANRVFGQVEGDFSYQGWIDALKAGRTFISNSPVLRFTVNGSPPGTTLAIQSGGSQVVEIEAVAESQLPYHHLEIVCNGQVVAEATPSGLRHHARIRLEHPVRQSCWIAARAFEDIRSYRARNFPFTTVHIERGSLHGNYFGTRRPETVFAHTSPVYVIRDQQPIRSWEDAEYYVRYLDRSIEWLKREGRFASETDRRASIEAFQVGRAIYEKRAQEAREAQERRD
ncbi:MAG: CehA/McbA family metallohydrolase [Acidobacteriota bacterium]